MKASLFIVLNEHNDVISYQIVPNDKREHVGVVLDSIFERQNSDVQTEGVYTDNPKSDKKVVEEAFSKHFKGTIATLQVCFICFFNSSHLLRTFGMRRKGL